MRLVIEELPTISVVGAEAIRAFVQLRDHSGMHLSRNRAHIECVAWHTLEGLRKRGLVELHWTARRKPTWTHATLTERGLAYRVVLDEQARKTA